MSETTHARRPLIFELDDFHKGTSARLPWGAIDADHCVCTIEHGTKLTATRDKETGRVLIVVSPGEGSIVPALERSGEGVDEIMREIFSLVADMAEVEKVQRGTQIKTQRLAKAFAHIRSYGTPKKQSQGAEIIKHMQNGGIDVNEAIYQMERLSSRVIKKNLSPTGHRSLARNHPRSV